MSDGCEQSHHISIPYMADDDFDPFQARLYQRYTRACGESVDGICREGTRALAEHCRMSVGKVVAARRQLAELGYIEIRAGRGDQPFEIALKDVRAANAERYAERSPDEHPVHDTNDTVQSMNESVHYANDTVHGAESVHLMNGIVHGAEQETPTRAREESLLLSSKDQEQELKDKQAAAAGARAQEPSRSDSNANTRIPSGTTAPLPGSAPPLSPRDTPLPESPRIYAVFVENMRQQITPVIRDKLLDAVKEFGDQWVEDAIVEAVTHNAKTWAYAEAVLDRWGKEGRDMPHPATNGSNARASPTAPPVNPPLRRAGVMFPQETTRDAKTG